MANEKHLLLSILGGYTGTAAAFTEETWQTSIRLALVFGTIDEIGTLPNNWEPTANTVNRTEPDWKIAGNWQVDGPGSSTFRPDDYLDEQAGPAVKDWLTGTNGFSSRVQLRELRLYPIGTNGKAVPAVPYAVGSPMTLVYTGTQPVGGNSGGMIPPQCSVVLSHRTSQIGRRGRGRSFTPPVPTGALTEGRLGDSTAASLLSLQAALLAGLALDTVGPFSAQIRPVITGHPWVNYAQINQVEVDTIFDTQRRRRRSASGTRSQASVDYT